MTTVNSIMKQFTRTIAKLEKHADKMHKSVMNKQTQIDALMDERTVLIDEREQAKRVAAKLREVTQ